MTPRTFWCADCHDWTGVQPFDADDDNPRCVRCGEPFRCDECGFEIDGSGRCQRPGGHHVPEDLMEHDAIPLASWPHMAAFYTERKGALSPELDCGAWWDTVDDTWRICVVSTTGDVYAVGARTNVVLLLATLPHGDTARQPYNAMHQIEEDTNWYDHHDLEWAVRTMAAVRSAT